MPQSAEALSMDPTGTAAERRIYALEAERDCRETLARYGFYADHGLSEEWVGLFTPDGVMDFSFYDDSQYLDDRMMPLTDDPTSVDFPLARGCFVGHEELRACITTPRHKRLEGRCQHHMDGQPALFRLVDDTTAIIVSNSVVYARSIGSSAPSVQYQNHSLNRWTFSKVGTRWLIAENIRRPMGSPDAAELLRDM